jgi:predicted Zn-dependent peptidase
MIEQTILDNGVTVVSDHRPHSHSTALGVWLLNGSRHQRREQNGYAHLLEHLLFKGTARHSGLELAQRFEAMGGQINAQTGRELTAFHGLVPNRWTLSLLELFAGMLLEPSFDDHDLRLERDVVFQEIAMASDTPDEAIEDEGTELAWPDHAMGWQILGARGALNEADAESVHDYLRAQLYGRRLCIVAVGGINHQELVEASRVLEKLPPGKRPAVQAPTFTAGRHHIKRPIHQATLQWLLPGPTAGSPDRPAAVLANQVLAGGVSSRLFQELREQRGLVYGVHGRLETYLDTGLWLIQTSCDPEEAEQCRDVVDRIVYELRQNGVVDTELIQCREHLEASLLLEQDDLEATMEQIARDTIYLGRVPEMVERMEELNATTLADVAAALDAAWREPCYCEMSP